ncbi:MAG TPA: fibro-slime domain-containing protein, partial [Symbiobacteriaceae bacterium]|nr:fibro-slime domain-containing protein [Symbiobacteriaceae bacterium]
MWGRIQGDRRFLLLLLAVFVAAWLAPRGARAAEAAPSELTVTGTVRDFRYCEAPGVPAGCSRDFELAGGGLDPGLVEPVLGPDGLPVYDGAVPHPTVASRESFDQWFRDVPGVNSSTELPVTLLRDPMTGLYTFMSYRFFPIDSRLLGNQGLAHNYHFTYQVRTRFTYNGGEQFMYRSNGDLWIFMNGQLVADLGGIHGTLDAVLNMDEVASRLELVQGQSYDLDLFYAQRRAPGSVLMFQTSLYMAPQPEVTAAGGAFPEGSPARLAVSIGGDGGAPHTAAVDWGDGQSTPPAPAPDMFDLFHTYADDGAYLATVTAAYEALGPGEGYAEFLIYNVAPQVAATARPGAQPGSILLRSTFTDPGLWDSPWRFRVDWGDGTQMLSWAADPSLMPQSIYHIYAAPGTYTVNVRVWDKDGDFGDTALQWLAD